MRIAVAMHAMNDVSGLFSFFVRFRHLSRSSRCQTADEHNPATMAANITNCRSSAMLFFRSLISAEAALVIDHYPHAERQPRHLGNMSTIALQRGRGIPAPNDQASARSLSPFSGRSP